MATRFQDYYKTLGVPRTASPEELQKGYRERARKYHPDVNKSPGAEEKFKEINEAHEVLKDAEKRRKYDTLGSNWKAGQDFRPPPGWENFTSRTSGTRRPGSGRTEFRFRSGSSGAGAFDTGGVGGPGFSDFFEALFGQNLGGDAARQSQSGGRRQPQSRENKPGQLSSRGQDYEVDITISLEEAYRAAAKTITLRTTQESGSGGQPKITSKRFDVKIPPGITEGGRIRLAGQGGAGRGAGESGDILLQVHIAPHAFFTLVGHDLSVEVPITPWEAALGAKVEVPTLNGRIKLTIPPGTQGGQRFRTRGKGLPQKKGEPGHLYTTIRITVPPTLTAEEKALFEELQKSSSFNPRKASEEN